MPRTGGRHDGEHEGRGRTRAPVIPADLKNWPAAGRPAAEALGRGGEGKLYASRRDARSDWYQNLLKNPEVTVEIQGRRFAGTAQLVTDEALCRKISQLKYRDDRGLEKRIVIEINLRAGSPCPSPSKGRH